MRFSRLKKYPLTVLSALGLIFTGVASSPVWAQVPALPDLSSDEIAPDAAATPETETSAATNNEIKAEDAQTSPPPNTKIMLEPALPAPELTADDLVTPDLFGGAGEDYLGLNETGDESFERSRNELQEEARRRAFDSAIQGLLPLRPEEIREVLEKFDRTQESVELPVYPPPKPQMVVENISLDPGTTPKVIKLALGHVTTLSILDATGAPWPIQDISWAGDFQINEVQNAGSEESFTHLIRITPRSEYATGNMSMQLLALQTPVILSLETNRDIVHYRFDGIIPDYGPLAQTPLINTGISTQAGNGEISAILQGIVPASAVRLNVAGADGRTSAYKFNGQTFVRTPLTLLSPSWNNSVSSADGTRVYTIRDAPVLLLSDKGKMVRVRLSERGDIFDD